MITTAQRLSQSLERASEPSSEETPPKKPSCRALATGRIVLKANFPKPL
jgi:hypothetical protein